MKICVWGDELAGWIAAAQLAAYGNDIIKAGSALAPAESAIRIEPGLMNQLEQGIIGGQIRSSEEEDPFSAEIHWLAIGPGELEAASEIVAHLAAVHQDSLLVVNQSNLGTGASDQLQARLDQSKNQHVVYLPDMLQGGQAMRQFAHPEVLLVGCENDSAGTMFTALMRPFTREGTELRLMSRREAEFTKFAITGMLALRLGYINELAMLADHVGVDIETVRDGMSTDQRVGPYYLSPGCGFGGQHFTQYIEGLAGLLSKTRGSTLLETVLKQNEQHKELPFRKLWQHYHCDLHDRRIAVWGLAFKPGVATVESAPSLRVVDALLAQGATIQLHDPEALEDFRFHYGEHPQLVYCAHPYEAVNDADALLLLTAWPEYWSPNYTELHRLMREPVIVDGRNVYDPQLLHDLGFTYYGVGRASH
ncbi:UDP-glucose 6-dehydrogenase [Marinobacterium zhoushanense]|uniref:UDP-glucose 6-dehydrogenase n=1 Tax=Marinobacterium zhoushanense TaxID=1679163 RepID=A0ABQ1KPW5_9GAMM|nr:nucleotide sugar dehydrogenase [Marinobacterium zhoushanense]GGC07032.1 UDP-glucose 6-dehydrogenase [Marinobacterium zhoushanense]